jgi:hypothetical protein
MIGARSSSIAIRDDGHDLHSAVVSRMDAQGDFTELDPTFDI